MTRPPDRLTPEERALASRLARIGPHGEPPAALDARILAAAHAAVAAAPPRRRWPAVLGVAATLALAIGVTWQLRPRPDASPVLQEGPVAAEAAPVAGATETAADSAAPLMAPKPSAAPPPVEAPTASRLPAAPAATHKAATNPPPSTDGAGNAGAREQARPSPQRALVPPAELPVIVDAQAMEDAAGPPAFAPSPPPPAPPAPPAPQAFKAIAPETVTVTGSRAAPRAASPQPAAADSRAVEALSGIDGRAARDVPVEEDARLDATAWLDRIRLRVAADDLSGARASLALFRRYHPDHAIPEDLAPLAQ